MGLSFDGNGKYVGWSNLFKYSSIEAIKASEYLPTPKHKVYTKTDDGFNIDKFVEEITNASNDVDIVRGYVKLLNYLNENNISEINYTVEGGKEVLKAIRSHEFTKIPKNLVEDANKNFISSHIQNTVQNLRNMIGAYTPIDMEVFRAASEKSPKGEQASKMTLFNPSTKLLMQYQNITGKNVIGIAANGEKASFMWHYYINDIVASIDSTGDYQQELNREIQQINATQGTAYETFNVRKYIVDSEFRSSIKESYKNLPILSKLDELADKFKYSTFEFTTSRLNGRASGEIKPITVNTLPDVFFDNIDPSIREKYGVRLTGNITVDLMISQVLSAATDNAKELILAKVNAGNKLAKMYLFLITLGFDINDIVKFMTSPAVSFIDSITETNIFTGQDTSIEDAIKLAKGDFSNFYTEFMTTRTFGKLSDEDQKKIKAGNTEGIVNDFSKGSREYIELENTIDAINEMHYLLNSAIDKEVKDILKNDKSKKREEALEEVKNQIQEDIKEFENVLEGANEFSNLGRLLGFNQGLPTSKVDLQSKIQFIQQILSKREEKMKVEGELIDVRRLFVDKDYLQEVKNRYEKVKKCINIFDVVDHIPQYNAIFEIFSAVMDIDHNISIKTRKYDEVYKKLKEGDGDIKVGYMDEQYQTRLLKGIDIAIISKFVREELGIRIPYKAGTKILNGLRAIVPTKEDGLLEFKALEDIASFKYIFENVIIPALKEGKIYDYLNDKSVEEIYNPQLANNKFIQSLIRGTYKEMPLYKCNLDMLTIENSQDSKVKFQKYLKGLQELQSIKINGTSLSDLFVLYNLIVNKNQYGSDRLTTLFDQFIQNSGQLSLIRRYLQFVGKLDYSGSVDDLDISIADLLKEAAVPVNSSIGQKNPTIIVQTENGPVLMRKNKGGSYVEWNGIVPNVQGESPDDTAVRIYNHNAYFVLGGTFSDIYDQQVQNIKTISNRTLNTINNLIRQGILTIQKICK